jgi:hypothetical protein
MKKRKQMTDIEDIIKTIPDDSYIKNYDDDEEDFLTDISGYFQHIKEELPSSSISKWEVGDKLVFKVTNFIEDKKKDPITNGENYYIVMERLLNNPEQEDKE